MRLERGLRLLSDFELVVGSALDGGYSFVGACGATPKILSVMRWGGPLPLSELALLGEGSLLAVSGIGRTAAEVAANALVDAGVSALMTFGPLD